MVKGEIIDIDLGCDIDDIINDDIRRISGEDDLKIAKLIQDAAVDSGAVKQEIDDKNFAILEKVYDVLLHTVDSDDCVSVDEILSISGPYITSAIGFVQRMKSFIRIHKGNDYILKKRKRNKETCYCLLRYNAINN